MRTVPVGMIPGSVRTVDGYAVLRNRLPVFTEHTEGTRRVFHAADADVYGTGIYRVASTSYSTSGIDAELYVRDVPDLTSISSSMTGLGILTYHGSGVSVCDGYIWYHKSNGLVMRRRISDGSEASIAAINAVVGMAGVSSTDAYLFYKDSANSYTISLRSSGSVVDTFHGAVYGEDIVPSLFDAVRIDGVDYIVYQEDGKRNVRMITRTGKVWGDSKLVFPLDVVDDTFQFRLGGVSEIDGRLVITGQLVRDDVVMKIYTIGPDHFSLGREMFIAEDYVDEYVINGVEIPNPIGKMLKVDDMLYVFGGRYRYYSAKSTILFGSDRTDQKATVEIGRVSFTSQANGASRAIFDVKASTDEPLLKSGSVMDWYASINGVEARMGRFSIDVVVDADQGSGNSKSVVARSLSLKSMATWESDSSFDYWSQTKQAVEATSMSELIRGSGDWEDEDGYLELANFNSPGVVYTVQRATRNGTAAGEFRVKSGTYYEAHYGVAIAYHRETPQDAAARLGEELAQDVDAVDNGLFFVVDSSDGSSKLSLVVDGVWTQLATGSSAISSATWHWLRIDLHDGRVQCYHRTGSANWVKVIDYRLLTGSSRPGPWFADGVGKAAIYMENVSPYSESYAFGSEADVIPVENNASFPTSATVKVDEETISYSGKSPNRSLGASTPLEWVDGKTFSVDERYRIKQPHYNSIPFPSTELVHVGETVVYWVNPRGYKLLGCSFVATDNWQFDSVDFYLRKATPNPVEVKVWLGTDDSNDGYYPASDTIIAECKREFRLGTPAYQLNGVGAMYGGEDWYRFNLPAKLRAGDKYYIYFVWNSTDPDGDFEAARSASVDKTRFTHLSFHGNSSTGYWITYEDYSLMIRAYGTRGTLPGHEIYMEGVGSQVDSSYYNGCSLVCTEGSGLGKAMKITGYDYYAPHQWVPVDDSSGWESGAGDPDRGSWVDKKYKRFYVAEDIVRNFGEGSKFAVVPSLTISNREEPTAHTASIVSIYSANEVQARNFQYFSAEPDISLGNMISEIARKANVLDITEQKKLSGTFTHAGPFNPTEALFNAIEGESAIIDFDVSSWGTGGIGLAVFSPGSGPVKDIKSRMLVITPDNIEYYLMEYSGILILESFPLTYKPFNKVTISFQKTCFSVWIEGQFISSFNWPESGAEETTFYRGFSIGVVATGDITYDVDWSQLDQRVDNFILDIGQTASSLVSGLIGEKRAFYIDDQNGDLRLFRERVEINPDQHLEGQIMQSKNSVDVDVKTRFRAEGVEVAETADYEALKEYGNLFSLVGLREPNNIAETMRELELISADSLRTLSAINVLGAADPRIEPEDIVLFRLKDGTYKFISVSGVSLTMDRAGESPIFDMSIDGQLWKDGGDYVPKVTSASEATFTTDKEQKYTYEIDASGDVTISIVE